jgi:hypothetical protein
MSDENVYHDPFTGKTKPLPPPPPATPAPPPPEPPPAGNDAIADGVRDAIKRAAGAVKRKAKDKPKAAVPLPTLPAGLDFDRSYGDRFRTKCACASCQTCCEEAHGVPLTPADLLRLVRAAGIKDAADGDTDDWKRWHGEVMVWAGEHLLASPGPCVTMMMMDLDGADKAPHKRDHSPEPKAVAKDVRVPMLVTRSDVIGRCHFHAADRTCAVHADAPTLCAFGDGHPKADPKGDLFKDVAEEISKAWMALGRGMESDWATPPGDDEEILYVDAWRQLWDGRKRGPWFEDMDAEKSGDDPVPPEERVVLCFPGNWHLPGEKCPGCGEHHD